MYWLHFHLHSRMNVPTFTMSGHLLRCISFLSPMRKVLIPFAFRVQYVCPFSTSKCLEYTQQMTSRLTGKKTKLWDLYNEVVYPPRENTIGTTDGEIAVEPRPAEVTYTKENILYSQKKLWLLAFMIRGLSVDEAFQQLGFRPEKGARILEKALEAAIERAVTEHDVEFCTNLWVEKALVLRGDSVPRIHKGLRTTVSKSNYHYSRLMLRLREGAPPALYHPYLIRSSWHPAPNCPADGAPGWGSAHDILDIQIRKIRRRRIPGEL
ncbi:unnamed protein product [Hydatigera taeniaeformis]|uniref:Large ribosomal subunit protein uL22m n=1 Tax=Hydatigena taeniaeformis TaxID=6205 RepID=A0A0R3WLA0_HYDTA|nr:unnamed protein product [Hydatigera taeniaeformis]